MSVSVCVCVCVSSLVVFCVVFSSTYCFQLTRFNSPIICFNTDLISVGFRCILLSYMYVSLFSDIHFNWKYQIEYSDFDSYQVEVWIIVHSNWSSCVLNTAFLSFSIPSRFQWFRCKFINTNKQINELKEKEEELNAHSEALHTWRMKKKQTEEIIYRDFPSHSNSE